MEPHTLQKKICYCYCYCYYYYHGYYKKKDPSPSHETDAAAARRVGLLREAKANQGDVRAVVLLVRALRERDRGNSHLTTFS